MKTFTADDETLLDLLLVWEEAPARLETSKLYDAAIAHIDERVRRHVAEVLDEAIETLTTQHSYAAPGACYGLRRAITLLKEMKG